MDRYQYAIAGVIYSLIYLILAVGAAGFGHGTYIFFVPAWPFGLGLLVYPLQFHLLDKSESTAAKALLVSSELFHLGLIAFLLSVRWPEELQYFERSWVLEPLSIILPVVWFAIGHLVLWIAFLLKIYGSGEKVRS